MMQKLTHRRSKKRRRIIECILPRWLPPPESGNAAVIGIIGKATCDGPLCADVPRCRRRSEKGGLRIPITEIEADALCAERLVLNLVRDTRWTYPGNRALS